MAQVSIPVEGMSCAACAARVERALKNTPGVTGAAVNLVTGKAGVEYDPGKVSVEQLVKTIRELGYQVPAEEVYLSVRGMSCAACVARVERAVSGLPEVADVAVSLPAETARITYYPGAVTPGRIKEVIAELGYEVAEKTTGREALDREKRARQQEIRRQARNMWIAWPLSLLIMLGMFRDVWILPRFVPEFMGNTFFLWALATPVVFIAGGQFFVHSFNGLKKGSTDMNLLCQFSL